ncbi:beta-N-acetylglucosaminidase, partial [Streptomyces cinereoruber]
SRSAGQVQRVTRVEHHLPVGFPAARRVLRRVPAEGHLGAVIAAHPDLQLRSATGRAPRGAVDIANPAPAKTV